MVKDVAALGTVLFLLLFVIQTSKHPCAKFKSSVMLLCHLLGVPEVKNVA
jgi:hypothetical protein